MTWGEGGREGRVGKGERAMVWRWDEEDRGGDGERWGEGGEGSGWLWNVDVYLRVKNTRRYT